MPFFSKTSINIFYQQVGSGDPVMLIHGLGGISMGSGISLRLALKHPERVSALILHRPAWLDSPLPTNLIALPIIGDLISRMGAQAGKAFFERSDFFRQIANNSPRCGQSLLGQFSRPQAEAGAEALWKMTMDTPYASTDDLSSIQVPTLVLASEDDPLHPLAFGQHIAGKILGAQFHEVVANYVDPVRHRAEVRGLVGAFLESC